ncbi:ATP-binding protein [Burkholderia cenocepacia]|uniref:ATP-binding protein n=1 Tax=Burkholderia cenocepacia TaxID=95486 RepID=UPI000F592F0B|nr:ATP-binding protein [Burkholderia cenocepacia]RQU58771.1 ATP-binding protein [Burkholderia cenocepacia]RQV41684.1 ATP-binding protein [Burkholderia cenocepacia]
MTFSLPKHIDPRHCVVTQQYAVYTPPMHEMIALIGDWIDQQLPGGYLWGASRLGKSRCAQYFLARVLRERFEVELPLIVWIRPADSHASEAGFWQMLLHASRFTLIDPTKAVKRAIGRHLCLQRFIAIAEWARRNYVILLIDEAQSMTLREWQWLMGLQNDLDHKGYLLSVFSIGSHQLNYKYDYFANTGNAHVSARFMAAHEQFHGLRTREELGYVLNGYDIDSRWPEGSDVSFLEYFAPECFALGKRLADCGDAFWKALQELTPTSARRLSEFPMQHVARTIEATLFELARGGDWSEVTSYESWLKRLVKTNFSDHMRIICPPS